MKVSMGLPGGWEKAASLSYGLPFRESSGSGSIRRGLGLNWIRFGRKSSKSKPSLMRW